MNKSSFSPRVLVLALAGVVLVCWSAVEGQVPSRGRTTNPARSGTNPNGPPSMFGGAGFGSGSPMSTLNPEAQQQQELQQLLHRHEQLSDPAQAAEQIKVREEIHTLLTTIFEQRQERRAAEIAEVEKRLTKLKDLHKKREEMKKTIIANRLNQLLEDSEGLGWGDDGPAADGNPGPFGLLQQGFNLLGRGAGRPGGSYGFPGAGPGGAAGSSSDSPGSDTDPSRRPTPEDKPTPPQGEPNELRRN